MAVARGIALVTALTLAGALGLPSAGATGPTKKLPACSVITPAELDPILTVPFRKGIADDAGACNFRKKVLATTDDIVVSVIPERFSSVKAAKRSFATKLATTTELQGARPETVQAGNDAFYTLFIGTDLLTMRAGSDVVEIRIENNSDDEPVYHDQIIAVAQAIALRLAAAK
jgi:hypothetical protein